ncbi:MAG: SGNH/GDSL hydrolase family protein [Clostridia bacterium]|nr:SGNH/GDSL hydrolase family protein [Clostridia bacterium]
MRIEEIDRNLKVETSIRKDDIIWLSPKDAPITIHGLCETELDMPYHRLPESVAKASNPGVEGLMWHTAGGRIRFATNSPYIAIKAVMNECGTMPHITKAGQSGFDLYGYTGGRSVYIGTFMPASGLTRGYESCIHVKPEMNTYTINMPLYDGVKELYIGLAKDSEIQAAAPYRYEKPVLYYGSSITQGGCASRPGNAYQGFIERKFDTDYINLGFSGSARAEEAMNEYLASLDASVFVCDYDHNAPSLEHLKNTHYPLYKTYREANPATPVVFVSKPDFRGDADSIARRAAIYETYRIAKENGDDNVYFIDGEQLFAGEFRDSCTVDGCHPNDLGFYRMGMVIGEMVGRLLTE